MSLSKEHPLPDEADQSRQPKCSRCRHHGLVIPKKGHTKSCPFLGCECWKCYLITQRTRNAALQRKAKKDESKAGDVKPAAKGPASTPNGAAASGGAAGSADPNTRSPLDLRARPDLDNREMVLLSSSEKSLTLGTWVPPNELEVLPAQGFFLLKGSSSLPPSPSGLLWGFQAGFQTRFYSSYFGELGRTGPLPVTPFPCGLPGHYPISYSAPPDFLLNMPWLPLVPVGLYNNNTQLCGPLMFPYIQPGAVLYPPAPEPGPPADCRQVFFSFHPPLLPETFQGELMSRQQPHPPLPKNTKQDVEE